MIVEVVYQSVVGGFVGWLMYRWGFKKGCDEAVGVAQKCFDRLAELNNEISKELVAAKALVNEHVPPDANPYRTKKKLPVVEEKNKVYCKDCKHVAYEYPGIEEDPYCTQGPWAENPVLGKHRKHRDFKTNDDYDCADYRPKHKRVPPPPELPDPPPPKRVLE